MSGVLGMTGILGIPRMPVIAVIVGIVMAGLSFASYRHGVAYGSAEQVRICQEELLKGERAANEQMADYNRKLKQATEDALVAVEEAAKNVAEVKIMHTPARIEVRKEIVERAVYRDCVVSERVFQLIGSALANEPAPAGAGPASGAGAPAGAGVVSGQAASAGRP